VIHKQSIKLKRWEAVPVVGEGVEDAGHSGGEAVEPQQGGRSSLRQQRPQPLIQVLPHLQQTQFYITALHSVSDSY